MPNASLCALTWNLYLGADVSRVIAAHPSVLPRRTSALWAMVQATDFPSRVRAIAAEIAACRPDVVACQEVYRWSVLARPHADGAPADERVLLDFLPLLTEALAHAGASYEAVVRSAGVNAVLPMEDGDWLRLEDSVALLVPSGGGPDAWRWSAPKQARFASNLRKEIDGEPFDISRGWGAVDLHRSGHAVRVVTAHVECFDAAVTTAQIRDLLDVPTTVDGPVVLLGDFNARPGSEVWETLREAGFRDAWSALRDDAGHTSGQDEDLRNPESALYERIDWLLARGGLSPLHIALHGATPSDRTPQGLWPSDHAGVRACFELTDPAPVRLPRPAPMPLPASPIDVVRTLYRHFAKFEVPEIMELVHPDARIHFPGNPAILPWAGDYRGAGLMRFFSACDESLEYLGYEAHTFFEQGDVVTALSTESCRVKVTGRVFTHELCAVIRVREGKIIEFLEYADTARMENAFTPLP